MEGSPYRKFSFSRRKGVVPWTGPGVLPSGDLGLPLIARFRHRTRGITCALKSTGVAHYQQASLRQDITPVILLSQMEKLRAFNGVLEMAEPGALVPIGSERGDSLDEASKLAPSRGVLFVARGDLSKRPSRVRAWSLRSDRAWLVRGLIAILELVRGRLGCVPIAFGKSREDYELSSRNLPLCELLYRDLFREFSAMCKLAGFLKMVEYWPIDKFWDLVSGCLILCLEMLETSVLGLGQDLGLITALGGAMTTLTYASCIVFDLIPSRFKVRDMFSAYVTCMRYYLCVGCTRAISMRWLSLFRTLRVCCDQQQTYWHILPFLSLREEYVFEKMLVCMTVWSSKKVPLSRKDVFTQIAKDVVGQGLDHGSMETESNAGG
ncbi:hypothetical protein F2Q69_00006011 [Brassica cretica]|uniref:Uncharacterized protein n=1 Tax=Brassica cretica TaxID=69181 RepID=A0A8S9P098_BRACR|nr:hypothetical protein F2Q69_00006011 [Brassica cretica]